MSDLSISCDVSTGEIMTELLDTHMAIVKQAMKEGVTERDDLIRLVLQWHSDRKQYWWTAKECAAMVDLALARINMKAKAKT